MQTPYDFLNKTNYLGPTANSTSMGLPAFAPQFPVPGTVASITQPLQQPVQSVVNRPVTTQSTGGIRTTTVPSSPATSVVPTTVPGSVAPIVPQAVPVPGYTAVAEDPEIAKLRALQEKYDRPQDAESIYQDKLAKQQSEIDAQNNIYNDMLNRSRIQNAPTYARRLGSTASLAVNQGLTGSNVGEGIQRDVEQSNMQEQAMQEALIEEKRAQAIAGIKGEIRKSAEATMAANIEANRQGVDARIKRLTVDGPAEKKASARRAVKGLLAAGIDVSKMTDEEKRSYLDGIGISSSDWNAITGEEVAVQTKAKEDAEKAKLENEKTRAETNNLINKNDFEAAQKALDRALEQKKIDVQWYNAESSRISATKESGTGSEKNYDAKTIPSDVKKELFSDIESNANMGGTFSGTKKKTLNEFITAYPEINTDYLTALYEANN